MPQLRVPMHIIRHMVYPYGARTDKRPTKVWVEPFTQQRQHGPTGYRLITSSSSTNGRGNLDEHEYQFFIGRDSQFSNVSECRCCKRAFYDKEARQKHFQRDREAQDISCAQKIILAMKILQEDGACVVCDTRTHSRKWGFPLCKQECVQKWCFTFLPIVAFDHALNEAKGRDWRVL